MALSTDVKVLGSPASPYVSRVQFALHLKSVKYELIEETSDTYNELLFRANPIYKEGPLFFHSDKSICESHIIVQYIDETWSDGPSILPSDPYDRAKARLWAAYIDDRVSYSSASFFFQLKPRFCSSHSFTTAFELVRNICLFFAVIMAPRDRNLCESPPKFI